MIVNPNKKLAVFFSKALLFVTSITFSQTTIAGGAVSGIWTKTGSPYIVNAAIMVANDSTLYIEPGVKVEFQGSYEFLILGRILAIGTINDSISFSPKDLKTGWLGIRFDNTTSNNDTSMIYFCKFQYGIANGSSPFNDGGALYFNGFSKAVVSNSLISNCTAASSGGGISCENSSPLITQNTIINNTASASFGGGGIYCDNSSKPIISYNTISHNSTGSMGGGIASNGGSPTIINNTISYNSSLYNGSGINCQNGSSVISDNIISNNSASNYGGGIFSFGAILAISNNLIANNTASSGGGMYLNSSKPILTNNTIVNNEAPNGGGLFCTNSSSPIFYNAIFWGNSASTSGNQLYVDDQPSKPDFYYCDIQGGQSAIGLNSNVFYLGSYSNNIDSNPKFVSQSGGSGTGYNGVTAKWNLQSESPCINTGDTTGAYPATDLAGSPRIVGGRIDIGAYEFQGGTTGIFNQASNTQFVLYPNPAGQEFIINFTSEKSYLLQIFDIAGKLILTQVLNSPRSTIDASNLPQGVYNVCVSSDQGRTNQRLVIVH